MSRPSGLENYGSYNRRAMSVSSYPCFSEASILFVGSQASGETVRKCARSRLAQHFTVLGLFRRCFRGCQALGQASEGLPGQSLESLAQAGPKTLHRKLAELKNVLQALLNRSLLLLKIVLLLLRLARPFRASVGHLLCCRGVPAA